ncbi:lytic transglycosylase domain-containing protein [Cellulomonas soli]|uniref:Murein transglycosylase n=1 Tax=Cellulomonas soli TaxID=931535 RepID=A0A512P9C2_9CELL|nr:lytic transglycosylase domain-containing protein [Cellulomonas soli]NYI60293.1 membrane-bound lytic murein transglycosylase B [Cellulomonas soli]GEP67804.1 murein transglycosylase [Cellulomonas soli]
MSAPEPTPGPAVVTIDRIDPDAPRGDRFARLRVALVRALVAAGLGTMVVTATALIHATGLPTAEPTSPRRALEPAQTAATSATVGAGSPQPATARVDPGWVERVAAVTAIPARALLAYAAADLVLDAEDPGCGLGWNTLAAIGAIESAHGTHGGARLGDDGRPRPAVLGIALDGDGVAAITDTDDGLWDGDTTWDRAVGPLQFIPSTWASWGADGDGDGVADPNQIDDAALAAARYLCHSGSLDTGDGWRAAVLSYNRSESYADQVATTANRYAQALS